MVSAGDGNENHVAIGVSNCQSWIILVTARPGTQSCRMQAGTHMGRDDARRQKRKESDDSD